MSLNVSPILNFNEVSKSELEKVGSKGLILGTLFKSKVPIPQGFIISSEAYFYFLDMARLREKILEILTTLDVDDKTELKNASNIIQNMIIKAVVPPVIESQITKSYSKLSGFINTFIAVRPSITYDQSDNVDFTQRPSTFLNIKGNKDLLLAIKASWASLFEPNAIYERSKKNINHMRMGLALIIQKMVDIEVSGMVYTENTTNMDNSKVEIEAKLGVNESYMNHEIAPDKYEVDKGVLRIIAKQIELQHTMLVRSNKQRDGDEELKQVNVAAKWQHVQKLSDKKIIELTTIAKVVEQLVGTPQQIEWIMSSNKIYIIQSKDILSKTNEIKNEIVQEEVKTVNEESAMYIPSKVEPIAPPQVVEKEEKIEEPVRLKPAEKKYRYINEIVLSGAPASEGIVEGFVKIVKTDDDFIHLNEKDILVINKVIPDYVLWIRKAAGIITNEGGMASHAAILSREFKIPCVVGAVNATEILTNNEYIQLNGNTGRIYKRKQVDDTTDIEVPIEDIKVGAPPRGYVQQVVSDIIQTVPQEAPKTPQVHHNVIHTPEIPKVVTEVLNESNHDLPSKIVKRKVSTATKIFANFSDPKNLYATKDRDIDGIGYINGTDILNKIINKHPEAFIEEEKVETYIDEMSQVLKLFCDEMPNSPVIYKPSNLIGSDLTFNTNKYETEESNPILGYNGTLRYLQNPSLFNLEVEIIKRVRNKYSHKNFSLLLPLIRDAKDLREIKKLISSNDLKRSSTFKIYLPIESPSTVLLINELLDIGVDGVFIFARSLSGHLNSVDLNNDKYRNFNVFNEAFMLSAEVVIKTAHKNKIHSGIIMEKGEINEEALKEFIDWGVTYISVDPHYIEKTRELVGDIEKSIILSRK